MPCMDDGRRDYYDLVQAQAKAQAKIDKLTRLLCEVMGMIGDPKEGYPLSHEVLAWWEDHQKADRAREEVEWARRKAEEERAAAVAKLSERERALLGIR